MLFSALPKAQGLYDPDNESDSCGVAMIADIGGCRSHDIVTDGLTALEHLEHRGAAGAEPNSDDGAGILLQLPVELLTAVVDFALPAPSARSRLRALRQMRTHCVGAGVWGPVAVFLPDGPCARAQRGAGLGCSLCCCAGR